MNTSRRRQVNSIPNSRWAAYAAAGAATALGGINSADAEIHYSGLIDAKFGNHTRTFQLDSAGPAALQFRHNAHYYSTFEIDGGSDFFAVFYGAAAGYSVSCASNNSIGSVSRLARHDVISQRPFSSRAAIMATVEGFGCGGGPRGQFRTGGMGFIGFRFNNGNGDQYGWARVKMGDDSRHRFILLDYAYGDPGDQVRAGDLSADEAPKLESLGGLAIGAAGLLAWRRRRAASI
jgi:hypothetical protein